MSDMGFIEFMFILIFLMLCGIAAALISGDSYPRLAMILGCVLGPVGLVIVLLVSLSNYTCSWCLREVSTRAKRCPHCQAELTPIG